MNIKLQFKPDLEKIKEQTSRTSLTLGLSTFVFVILLAAVLLTALGLWILTATGVIVDIEGELQLGSVILFMLLSSVIIGGVMAYFSSRIPLKPINNLINKLNRLAAGDFKARLDFGRPLSSHSAFQEISTSFNTMAEELENTELLRNDFINHFSHEFKTPIVSIKGLAKLLENEDLTAEQRMQYLRAIQEESTRLSDMATNVLNLTKIENQSILTAVSQYNLAEQLRSSVLLLEDRWTHKEIDLQLEFAEYDIKANEELLKQVWINLIDNAIKFAPHGGVVSMSMESTEDWVYVSISNTGPEIPAEKLDKIFHKFYQADESHATQGNGIGLAIVKRVVQLHQGMVEVNSEQGMTTFTVALPI